MKELEMQRRQEGIIETAVNTLLKKGVELLSKLDFSALANNDMC